jgi:hypothetical protein
MEKRLEHVCAWARLHKKCQREQTDTDALLPQVQLSKASGHPHTSAQREAKRLRYVMPGAELAADLVKVSAIVREREVNLDSALASGLRLVSIHRASVELESDGIADWR